MVPGIKIESVIETVHKIHSAVLIEDIFISQQTIKGRFKVILDDGAMINICNLFPNLLKWAVCLLKQCFDCCFGIADCWEHMQVSGACMNVDEIWMKVQQFRGIKHHLLKVLVILGLIKFRPDTRIEQKKFQNFFDIMGSGAA